MFKFNTVPLAPLAVLALGLASCSQEQKVTDAYVAPIPKIRTSNGVQSLTEWNNRSVKIADLEDSFDFAATAASAVTIQSMCRLDGEDLQEKFTFRAPREIRFFQLLPARLLTQDLEQHLLACGFELTLQNGEGARHIFPVSALTLKDQKGGRVQLAQEPEVLFAKKTRLKATLTHLEGIRMRYENSGHAEAQVICQDLSTRALPFASVLELLNFDFIRPQTAKIAELLVERPLQICRTVILQQGQRTDVSDLFQLIFPSEPPPVRLVLTPYPAPSPANLPAATLALRGTPLALALWQISNPNKSVRYMRIPTKGLSGLINVFNQPPGLGSLVRNLNYQGSWFFIGHGQKPAPEFEEDRDAITYKLARGQSATIAMYIIGPGPIKCASNQSTNGFMASAIDPFPIEEVAVTKEVLSTIKIAPPAAIYVTDIPVATIPGLPPGELCSWP